MKTRSAKKLTEIPTAVIRSVLVSEGTDKRRTISDGEPNKRLLLPLAELPPPALAALKIMAAEQPTTSDLKAAATLLVMLLLRRDPHANRPSYILSTVEAVDEFMRIGKPGKESDPGQKRALTGRCAARLLLAMP